LRTASLALLVLSACSPLRTNDALLKKIGEACEQLEDCGAALVCAADGVCTPVGEPGTADREEPCAGDTDCRIEYVCGGAGRCARSRQGEVADTCNGDESCGGDLVCNREGRCGRMGEPGTVPGGGMCTASEECGFGLVCGADGLCNRVPLWSGVECETLDGPTRVLFEVPEGGRTTDFYRLPFPNDVLRTGTAIDFDGYPGLEQFPEPGVAVGNVLAALEVEGTGFSLNPAIIFRFSRAVEFATATFSGDRPNFIFVDITADNPSRGRRPRARFFATTDRARSICQSYLSIRPSEGTPLEVGHTYAVMFLTGLLDTSRQPVNADADFRDVMGPTRPRAPALAAAWDRYQPLKSWLAESEIPVDSVIGATVFTTGDPLATMAAMRPAVQAAPAPELTRAVSCDDARSPCAGSPGRGCGPRNPAFIEVDGIATLPGFLEGVAPFERSGGTVHFEGGRPRVQRQEEVCVALTVPRNGPRPVGGWPVVVFAHDLGDHYRSFIERGLAQTLAEAGWATISYDGVLQGARGGGADPLTAVELETRFNDPLDPVFMRDHAFQGAADLFGLVRMLRSTRLRVGMADLGFNREHIVFLGHGRGGELGAPFAAYEADLQAAIFAASGGSVVDQLQYTLKPVNEGARFGVALAEPHLNGMNPGLHLYQNWLDTRDPMNYAALLRSPPEELLARHVFYIYGTGDTITPARTMNFLATGARLGLVGTAFEELQAIQPVDGGPIGQGNVRINGRNVTQVIKQYRPGAGADGHFVLFDSPEVKTDLSTFLRALIDANQGIPSVAP